ncbi:MAG: oxidoreductase [Bacteroidetes bacterium]|nr:oxidoreductase [Bacteroidota bacterium]
MNQSFLNSTFNVKKIFNFRLVIPVVFLFIMQGCNNSKTGKEEPMKKIHLTVLDPGHFHAALVQKTMYSQIDSNVNVYAPDGPDVESYLKLVNSYNSRKDNPTSWKLNVYKGADYLEKFLLQEKGSLAVLAGNNKYKTDYISKSIQAGFNVLSDKPMAITPAGFEILKNAFDSAAQSHTLLYDIMTSRYEITNILERELSKMPEVFGEMEKGTAGNPAISKQSTHYFLKNVSGAPLIRPAWYFDTEQEGEGIVDITTHLVDLVQWECFPEQILDYGKDVTIVSAKRWPTLITLPQYSMVTKQDTFPGYLKKDLKNNVLNVYANGEINYTLKGIHSKVSVSWNYQAQPGSGDTYFSMLRGTKANLIIRQDKEQQFKPTLYIEPVDKSSMDKYGQTLTQEFKKIEATYPGIALKKLENGWQVIIPEQFVSDHEQQFSMVTNKFLDFLKNGKIPDWEISFMKTKYFTTTQALEKALSGTKTSE